MIKFKKVDFDRVGKGLEHIEESLKPYKSEIVCVLLFGSLARGQVGPLSDVDIAVLFEHDISQSRLAELENELYKIISGIIGTDELDLVTMNQAPLRIRYNILHERKILLCNDSEVFADFYFNTVREYLDFKPFMDEFNNEFLRKV